MGGPGAVPPDRDIPEYARTALVCWGMCQLFWVVLGFFKHGKRLLGGILLRFFAAAAGSNKFCSIGQFQPNFKNLCVLWPTAAQPGIERGFAKELL